MTTIPAATGLPYMSAPSQNDKSFIDADEIRRFLDLIHRHALQLAAPLSATGVLQLICAFPDVTGTSIYRFRLGDVEGMARQAIAAASSGLNVWVECRTVRRDLHGPVRGTLRDTIFVFGLVEDVDADKGMAPIRNTIPGFVPSMINETSGGNEHGWYFFDRAVGWQEARKIGECMQLAAHDRDHTTGNLVTPFRVPGTPRYPNATKRARGRVIAPTFMRENSGRLWSPDDMRAILPGMPPENLSGLVEVPEGPIFIDVVMIASALNAIPNSGDYVLEWSDWFAIVCACHWAADQCDDRETATLIIESRR